MLDAEPVQNGDHESAQVIGMSGAGAHQGDEHIDCLLVLPGVEGEHGSAHVDVDGLFEPYPGREPVSLEVRGDVAEQVECAVTVTALAQKPGKQERGVGTAWLQLQRLAQ